VLIVLSHAVNVTEIHPMGSGSVVSVWLKGSQVPG